MTWAPLARIILRYLAGLAVGYGFFAPDDAALFEDPEMVALVGTGIGVVVEAVYALAVKRGWAT